MLHSETAVWWLFLLASFLSGSLMFSQWLPRLFCRKDITQISNDANPGATNVFIHCGPVMGMICLSLDLLKGFVPVYLCYHLLNPDRLWFALVMAAPVLGHALAPLAHFRGGKCIATSFGVLLALFPMTHIVLLLAGIYIVFSTMLKIHPNSSRSIVTFGLFGTISLLLLLHSGRYSIAGGCLLISAIVIYKHAKQTAAAEKKTLSHCGSPQS